MLVVVFVLGAQSGGSVQVQSRCFHVHDGEQTVQHWSEGDCADFVVRFLVVIVGERMAFVAVLAATKFLCMGNVLVLYVASFIFTYFDHRTTTSH